MLCNITVVQQFVLVSAPESGSLECLEKEQVVVLSQRFVPEGLSCTWLEQTLLREEMKDNLWSFRNYLNDHLFWHS